MYIASSISVHQMVIGLVLVGLPMERFWYSRLRTVIRWLMTVIVPSSHRRSTRSSLRCCSRPLQRPCLLVIVVVVLVSTLMFSSWNVCRPDIDDDVDALMAGSLSTRSVRRPAKVCLSPLTEAGLRVNISLDSHNDLHR